MFGWFKKKKQAPEVTAVHRLTPGKNLPDNFRSQLTEKERAVRELQRASNWRNSGD